MTQQQQSCQGQLCLEYRVICPVHLRIPLDKLCVPDAANFLVMPAL